MAEFKIPGKPPDQQKHIFKKHLSEKSKSFTHLDEKMDLYSSIEGDPQALNHDGYVHPVPPPTTTLSHLSYFCPGLHGPGTRQDVSLKCFKELLEVEERLIIPIFQRRYCWDPHIVHKWYDDARKGTREFKGIHSTGNLVIKWSHQDQGFILIDGQQRVTTTLLFLAAIRDVAESLCKKTGYLKDILDKISRIMFVPNDPAEEDSGGTGELRTKVDANATRLGGHALELSECDHRVTAGRKEEERRYAFGQREEVRRTTVGRVEEERRYTAGREEENRRNVVERREELRRNAPAPILKSAEVKEEKKGGTTSQENLRHTVGQTGSQSEKSLRNSVGRKEENRRNIAVRMEEERRNTAGRVEEERRNTACRVEERRNAAGRVEEERRNKMSRKEEERRNAVHRVEEEQRSTIGREEEERRCAINRREEEQRNTVHRCEEERQIYVAGEKNKKRNLVNRSKLLPCCLDRDSFYSIITRSNSAIDESVQTQTYRILLGRTQKELSKITSFQRKLETIEDLFYQCTEKMGVTLVKIEDEIDMPQVFLWLQEKSLNASLLLLNPSPGAPVKTCDLVRNLVLAPLLSKSIQDQEDIYLTEWLMDLEEKFCTREQFNLAVKKYTDTRHENVQETSDFENHMTQVLSSGKLSDGQRFAELFAYAKFVTVFESFTKATEALQFGVEDDGEPEMRHSRFTIQDMKSFLFQS